MSYLFLQDSEMFYKQNHANEEEKSNSKGREIYV